MILHLEISDASLRENIKLKTICFGGNRQIRIYGTLQCSSGKKMKRENRVFFITENEALTNNYRPCGHCMKTQYQKWKNGVM